MIAAIDAADAPVEAFDYPGAGHLFTDPSLPDEYAPDATGLLRQRVLALQQSWGTIDAQHQLAEGRVAPSDGVITERATKQYDDR